MLPLLDPSSILLPSTTTDLINRHQAQTTQETVWVHDNRVLSQRQLNAISNIHSVNRPPSPEEKRKRKTQLSQPNQKEIRKMKSTTSFSTILLIYSLSLLSLFPTLTFAIFPPREIFVRPIPSHLLPLPSTLENSIYPNPPSLSSRTATRTPTPTPAAKPADSSATTSPACLDQKEMKDVDLKVVGADVR